MATTTDYATGEWAMLFETDGDGRPDSYWCIEQDPEGFLCVTSNAVTRERVSHWTHGSCNPGTLREGMMADGMPAEVIDRFLEQAGF